MKDRALMLRVVRNLDGNYSIDLTQKADGRGAYICRDAECLAKVIKTKALNRSFHGSVPGSIYGELELNIEDFKDETG